MHLSIEQFCLTLVRQALNFWKSIYLYARGNREIHKGHPNGEFRRFDRDRTRLRAWQPLFTLANLVVINTTEEKDV